MPPRVYRTRPRMPRAQAPIDAVAFMRQLVTMHGELKGGIALIERALAALKDVKRGERGTPGAPGKDGSNGRDGKNATQQMVDDAVARIVRQPNDGKPADETRIMTDIMASKKFRKALVRAVLDALPEQQQKDVTPPDPEQIALMVMDQIREVMPDMKQIEKQIENRTAEVRNHVATKSGMRGGGDTVVAGTGVTITNTVNGNKEISATASGSTLTAEIPDGNVDGSNTTFTVTHTPVFVMIDGLMRVDGYGYTYAAGTISVDPVAPPTQSIVSFYNA